MMGHSFPTLTDLVAHLEWASQPPAYSLRSDVASETEIEHFNRGARVARDDIIAFLKSCTIEGETK